MNKLTCVIVNLIPESVAALEDAALLEGETRTETVNRALQLYCQMVAERRIGARFWVGRRRLTAEEMRWS